MEDISPLAKLKELSWLNLRNTKVEDITALAGLSTLTELFLARTQVQDIAPIAELRSLQVLWLEDTPIADLRPLRDLKGLAESSVEIPLRFENTAATAADPGLAEIAGIEDGHERVRQFFAYLDSLPTWPEPLPYDPGGTTEPIETDARSPAPRPAVPSPLRPRLAQLREILSTNPAGFADHVQDVVAMLQEARARQIPAKPNDPVELAAWEQLVLSLDVAENTLAVLHPLIPDAPVSEPSEAEVNRLIAALEAAVQKLRDGCGYLDHQTGQAAGHHYASLHKIGISSAIGGAFAAASGAPVLAATAAVAALLYGADFAKSMRGFFGGGGG